MMNMLGKGLALLHVMLSIMLMGLALALYFNAVDFGWEQPARYWRETKARKDDNLLIPSVLDKREAAMRQLVRNEHDELQRLGHVQRDLGKIEKILADNHLEGTGALDILDNGENTFTINDVKFDGDGKVVLDQTIYPQYGPPKLDVAVPGINRSYKGYLEQLDEQKKLIDTVLEKTKKLQENIKKVTERLTGELDENAPGWYVLLENEVRTQNQLEKEKAYLQPLWAKELADAAGVLVRRDRLLERLRELGDTGYLSQSQFQTEALRRRK